MIHPSIVEHAKKKKEKERKNMARIELAPDRTDNLLEVHFWNQIYGT